MSEPICKVADIIYVRFELTEFEGSLIIISLSLALPICQLFLFLCMLSIDSVY